MVQRPQIEAYAEQDGVIVVDYDVHPHHMHFTTHKQTGFVGRCTYQLRSLKQAMPVEPGQTPLSLPQQCWLLSQLAFYSGVGYKTSMGMGRTRLIA